VQEIGSHEGSYFALMNADWLIIGLDTSLEDANPLVTAQGTFMSFVPEPQAEWARSLMDLAIESNRGIIMLSHHMLFSSHETCGKGKTLSYANERVYEQFKDYIDKIDCWLWGHEHNWTRYASYRGLRRGRLQGNGGVPVQPRENTYAVKDVPGQEPPQSLSKPPATFSIPDSIHNKQDVELYANGLYSLKIDGDQATLEYFELHQMEDDSWMLEAIEGESETWTKGN